MKSIKKPSLFSSHEIQAPPFGVSYIRISNVGAIDDLHINLLSRSLLSIYAGNGIGKTTILECLSLIGHLPCFPSLCVGGKFEDSELDRHFGKIADDSREFFISKLKFSILNNSGIEA